MIQFNEHDVVTVNRQVATTESVPKADREITVPAGTRGTIVSVHSHERGWYAVEFNAPECVVISLHASDLTKA